MNDLINQLISAGIKEQEAKKETAILFQEFGKNNPDKIKEIVTERIKSRTPLQYLLGKACFMDFEIKVNKKVLIPRPETEILVEETVKRFLHRDTLKHVFITALDIGTGSGCISIALARLIPNIKITAIDIEKDIIDLAYENAKKYSTEKQIHFKVCDLFSKCAGEMFQKNKFDLIISNPPYIKEETCHSKSLLQPEIQHEPKIALYGSKENKTGLIYYERIIEFMGLINQTHTMIALEIDPPIAGSLKSLLKKEGLNNFEITKDYAGLERCLFVYL